jgi:hypothetical protein
MIVKMLFFKNSGVFGQGRTIGSSMQVASTTQRSSRTPTGNKRNNKLKVSVKIKNRKKLSVVKNVKYLSLV